MTNAFTGSEYKKYPTKTIAGKRIKSIGAITVAGAKESAAVKEKCASRPAQAIRMTQANFVLTAKLFDRRILHKPDRNPIGIM